MPERKVRLYLMQSRLRQSPTFPAKSPAISGDMAMTRGFVQPIHALNSMPFSIGYAIRDIGMAELCRAVPAAATDTNGTPHRVAARTSKEALADSSWRSSSAGFEPARSPVSDGSQSTHRESAPCTVHAPRQLCCSAISRAERPPSNASPPPPPPLPPRRDRRSRGGVIDAREEVRVPTETPQQRGDEIQREPGRAQGEAVPLREQRVQRIRRDIHKVRHVAPCRRLAPRP